MVPKYSQEEIDQINRATPTPQASSAVPGSDAANLQLAHTFCARLTLREVIMVAAEQALARRREDISSELFDLARGC